MRESGEAAERKFPVTPRRSIPASVLTDFGWISGSIIIPKLNSLVDILNIGGRFVKLTDVLIPGLPIRLPFFALARNSFSIIIPAPDDRLKSVTAPAGSHRQQRISCLFSGGHASGLLETIESARVSDFLAGARQYFTLTGCTLRIKGKVFDAPLAILDSHRLTGVSEPDIEQLLAEAQTENTGDGSQRSTPIRISHRMWA